jgi:hypothetical protein
MTDPDAIDLGVAGRSARREAERKHQRRLQAEPKRDGARLIRALVGPSAQEKRLAAEEKHWNTGGGGEELLAASLAKRSPGALLLNDRKVPGSRANIDHIAVAACGVYVVDAKRYRGKIEVHAPLFGASKLKIAGRDRTKLIDGLDRQVCVVRDALANVGAEAPVHGCLCFLAPEGLLADSGLPLLRTLSMRGYPLYYPRRLAKCLNGPGPMAPEQVSAIAAALAQQLPAA